MDVKIYSQRDKVMVREMAGHVFSPQERLKRSLLRLFSFLGLALVSILVPVFHFVLVPLFALLAPFMGWKTYKEEVVLEAATLSCPECQKEALFAKNSGQWPLHNTCPHCMNRIYFDQATPAIR